MDNLRIKSSKRKNRRVFLTQTEEMDSGKMKYTFFIMIGGRRK